MMCYFKARLTNRDDGNHLISTCGAVSLGNVKGAEHSGALISPLDIAEAEGYASRYGDAFELEKHFSNNATIMLTDSGCGLLVLGFG